MLTLLVGEMILNKTLAFGPSLHGFGITWRSQLPPEERDPSVCVRVRVYTGLATPSQDLGLSSPDNKRPSEGRGTRVCHRPG